MSAEMDGIIKNLQEPEITVEQAAAKLKDRWQRLEVWFNRLPHCMPVGVAQKHPGNESWTVRLELIRDSDFDSWHLVGHIHNPQKPTGKKKRVEDLSLQDMSACIDLIEPLIRKLQDKVSSQTSVTVAAVESFDNVINRIGLTDFSVEAEGT